MLQALPDSSSYKAHLYSHHEDKFKCKQCNKTFPFLSGVANHKRARLKQKLFKCFAGSGCCAFKHPQDLRCHMGMHLTHAVLVMNAATGLSRSDYLSDIKLCMWMSTNITVTIVPLIPNINGQLIVMRKSVINVTLTNQSSSPGTDQKLCSL